jgi:hypothetical protein
LHCLSYCPVTLFLVLLALASILLLFPTGSPGGVWRSAVSCLAFGGNPMTADYTNDDLRQIRREARATPDAVSCPRCSLRTGRRVPLRAHQTGLIVKFSCSGCGEQVTITVERSTER